MKAIRALAKPSISLIPRDVPLTEDQRRVRDSVVQGTPVYSETLKTRLAEIVWPACYLDFETTATAVPLYPGIAPWQQILTQYSLHICLLNLRH